MDNWVAQLIPQSLCIFSTKGLKYVKNYYNDSITGLQWQDDIYAQILDTNWTNAIDFCENELKLGGYDDWRLPNINELLTIVDYTRDTPALDDEFTRYVYGYFWSSTSGYSSFDRAWCANFRYGNIPLDSLKSETYYVRCVRGGQTNIDTPANPSIIISSQLGGDTNVIMWQSSIAVAQVILSVQKIHK